MEKELKSLKMELDVYRSSSSYYNFYEEICKNPPHLIPALLTVFNKTAIEVCEGQQMDMNLPNQELISDEEYLQMIRLKTAVLPACALKMGALAANASLERADVFYDFGSD